jgi:membrane fusion protein (multidrug efflux system)
MGKEVFPKKTNERKKPVFLGTIVLLVLVLSGLTVGYFWLNDMINFVSTDDAAIDGDHVTISAKTLGRIRSLFAEERDKIKSGQLLVQMDEADLLAQKTQALASLRYANQNLIFAKVNLDRAKDDFQRAKKLFNSGVSTKEQYNHASKSYETSKTQLGIVETQLQNTKITSPITGIIAKKSFVPGDVVQPGQAIYIINNLDSLWVTANFEETKIRHIRPGEEVEITIDAYPGGPFKGIVTRISAGIVTPPFSIGEFTKTTQRVPVKIDFKNLPESLVLLPGMSVEVKIKIK